MAGGQGITQEQSLGEVVSKTFDLYRREFWKYAILFVVLEAIIGVATTLLRRATVVSAAPTVTHLGGVIPLIAVTLILALVFYPFTVGAAVKMASDEIEMRPVDLGASVRAGISKIVWLWAVGLVVGIIVLLGTIALIVPGIILAIMFSLVVPVIIIEGSGFESMSRSRRLVSKRWLKTFALFLVIGIIIGIPTLIVDAITAHLGVASTAVSGVISGFYVGLSPIALTVYYYSNVARIAPPQTGPVTIAPGAEAPVGKRYCSSCGALLAYDAKFCPSCGAKQTT